MNGDELQAHNDWLGRLSEVVNQHGPGSEEAKTMVANAPSVAAQEDARLFLTITAAITQAAGGVPAIATNIEQKE